MELLQPVIRPYDWGSRHGIAELQGRPVPAAGPEAELWMGAHPSAPSGVAADHPGRRHRRRPGRASSGRECVARFGPRLPFLLKVLSADRALSIQVHPSRAQAETGFRAENDARPGARRPGPELRRRLAQARAAVRPDPVRGAGRPAHPGRRRRPAARPGRRPLAPLAADLEAATSPEALSRALAAILDLAAEPWRRAGRRRSLAACAGLAVRSGSPYAAACAAAVREAADHPGDLGVVAMLLMRHVVLAPGQAVFMPAGGLHAYLRGTGIEVLANSDNVVRAGLTGKHVDVPELLKLLDPAVTVPVLSPAPVADGVSLVRHPGPGVPPVRGRAGRARRSPCPATGPRIVLCTDGAAALRSGPASTVKLARGESCFVSAADGPLRAAGPARLFLAAPGAARVKLCVVPDAVGGRVSGEVLRSAIPR